MSDDLKVREALGKTMADQGKSTEYIRDFLDHFDRNLKNIDDWRDAKQALNKADAILKEHNAGGLIKLRADEYGKPDFHVDGTAMTILVDHYAS